MEKSGILELKGRKKGTSLSNALNMQKLSFSLEQLSQEKCQMLRSVTQDSRPESQNQAFGPKLDQSLSRVGDSVEKSQENIQFDELKELSQSSLDEAEQEGADRMDFEIKHGQSGSAAGNASRSTNHNGHHKNSKEGRASPLEYVEEPPDEAHQAEE